MASAAGTTTMTKASALRLLATLKAGVKIAHKGCEAEIPAFAASSASANLIPVPGLGFAADLGIMIGMAKSFASEYAKHCDMLAITNAFGSAHIRDKVASATTMKLAKKAAEKAAIKAAEKKGIDVMLKTLAEKVSTKVAKKVAVLTGEKMAKSIIYKTGDKMAAKGAAKFLPGIGSLIAAGMATKMTHAAGYDLIAEFDALYLDCVADAQAQLERQVGASLKVAEKVKIPSRGYASIRNDTAYTMDVSTYNGDDSLQWVSYANYKIHRGQTVEVTAKTEGGIFKAHFYDSTGEIKTTGKGYILHPGKVYSHTGWGAHTFWVLN